MLTILVLLSNKIIQPHSLCSHIGVISLINHTVLLFVIVAMSFQAASSSPISQNKGAKTLSWSKKTTKQKSADL